MRKSRAFAGLPGQTRAKGRAKTRGNLCKYPEKTRKKPQKAKNDEKSQENERLLFGRQGEANIATAHLWHTESMCPWRPLLFWGFLLNN